MCNFTALPRRLNKSSEERTDTKDRWGDLGRFVGALTVSTHFACLIPTAPRRRWLKLRYNVVKNVGHLEMVETIPEVEEQVSANLGYRPFFLLKGAVPLEGLGTAAQPMRSGARG